MKKNSIKYVFIFKKKSNIYKLQQLDFSAQITTIIFQYSDEKKINKVCFIFLKKVAYTNYNNWIFRHRFV